MKITLKWLREFLPEEKNLSKERVSDALISLGIEVEKAHQSLEEEHVFEIALTPNLGHCMSIYGVARELSAVFQTPLSFPTSISKEPRGQFSVTLDWENAEVPLFSVYTKLSLTHTSLPPFLEKRLSTCDISTSGFFDALKEYSIHSCGIPLHILDLENIQGPLRIAPATQNMSIEGISVCQNALLIFDQQKPVALAGICEFPSAKPKDQEALLLSIYIPPEYVRPAIKHSGVRSSGAKRMERGIDAQFMKQAISYTTKLFASVDSGLNYTAITSSGLSPKTQEPILCRLDKINTTLGTNISYQEAHSYLERLGFALSKNTKDQVLICTPPSYRYDISNEIDLIEEVGRLYGFNNIPDKPIIYSHSPKGNDEEFLFQEKIRHALLSIGLQEIISCDLISPEQASLLQGYTHSSEDELISVLQPSSQFQSILRPSLYSGLLSMAAFNHARQIQNMRVFEVGRIYKKEKHFVEMLSCGFLLSGKRYKEHYTNSSDKYDFFDLKGIAEELFKALNSHNVEFVPSVEKFLQTHQQAHIFLGKQRVGILGKVPPRVLRQLQLQQDVFFAEIQLSAIEPLLTPLSKIQKLYPFPGVERDWTITLPKKFHLGALLQAFSDTHPLLQKTSLQDIYTDEAVGTNTHNVTVRMTYRSREKTLNHSTIKKAQEEVMQKVAKKLDLRVPLEDA